MAWLTGWPVIWHIKSSPQDSMANRARKNSKIGELDKEKYIPIQLEKC